MSATTRQVHYSYAEYLTLEKHATVRHEYLDGEIYALEQQEELLIEALEEQGHDIARRVSANPAAALGLPDKAAA